MPHREEAPGKTQDTLERLCLSAGLGTPQGPSGRAGGSVWGEGVLKKNGPKDLKDYWPVALTSHIMKTFERLIFLLLRPQVSGCKHRYECVM
ncbi:hypothetical protein QTP70_013474 [Hemibagrus guttatus]|uniref:Uncharacterized protein n=1 Tax=Hemibagrus guttatus TaxID=175788 RepID=A0AAE0Q866_9TELE|nr:hypothetical protein QTP70_013474 [Hemibagrus guttatus]